MDVVQLARNDPPRDHSPEAAVLRSTLGWDAVCQCGYVAPDIPAEETAARVVAHHCQATGHHLRAA